MSAHEQLRADIAEILLTVAKNGLECSRDLDVALDAIDALIGRPVLQAWVRHLPYMQQGVLVSAVRGADTLPKDHVSKLLQRWLRRCILICAFDGEEFTEPASERGGSFTGPSIAGMTGMWEAYMDDVRSHYIARLDEVPHHFQLHFLHAAEIIGYQHPVYRIESWWLRTYEELCKDMHLTPETRKEMNARLGDNEAAWRKRETVPARQPIALPGVFYDMKERSVVTLGSMSGGGAGKENS